MDMYFLLQVIQVVSAFLLVAAILAQRSEASVGSAFGGSDLSETGVTKRRGSEKILFVGTIFLAIIFAGSVIATPVFS